MTQPGAPAGHDPAPPSVPRERRGGLAALVIPGIGFMVALAILLSLGTWQVQRLAWKEDLIARVAERVGSPPVAAPPPAEWDGFSIDAWQFRPVEVMGTFRDRELHVYIALTRPQGPLGGPGYFVVSPLETTDGWFVLVNRGFVPDPMKEPAERPADAAVPDGVVTVTGLVRENETPNFVTPEPNLETNVWFARDIEAMAGALDLPAGRTAPYLIDAAAPMTPAGGVPQAGETRISFPNNHLQYALTWYGLAATCVIVFALFVRRRLTGR